MLSENAQATLLLAAYFTSPKRDAAKPLTPTEWGRFAAWLRDSELSPGDLLRQDAAKILTTWQDHKITHQRLEGLLDRGHALALAMEKWSRAGIWVLTRSDRDYPWRLKKRLKVSCPPVLFGCGSQRLLNHGGVAVVGSRNIGDSDLDFTRGLGKQVAEAGASVVSGGARGVDESAMVAALETEGTAVGVLADSLLKAATSKKWRRDLMDNNLVLVSPFYPEAGFNTGNAMARNKYIYCLADSAVVVHSGIKGGTWNGALENLRHDWVPLWVKPTKDPEAGNNLIVQKGARWYEANSAKAIDINTLSQPRLDFETGNTDLFAPLRSALNGQSPGTKKMSLRIAGKSDGEGLRQEPDTVEHSVPPCETEGAVLNGEPLGSHPVKAGCTSDEATTAKARQPLADVSLYDLFECKLEFVLATEPLSVEQIAERFDLKKGQVQMWLATALEKSLIIRKRTRPVRYEWIGPAGC